MLQGVGWEGRVHNYHIHVLLAAELFSNWDQFKCAYQKPLAKLETTSTDWLR